MKKFALLMTLVAVFATGVYAKEYPWALRIKDDGVTVYTRPVEGSAMIEFQADIIVDAPIEKVIPLFEDVKGLTVWYHQCIQAQLIKDEDPNDKLVYIVLNLPWPVAKRDSVFRRHRSDDPATGAITYTISALPNEIPKKRGRIRVQKIDSVWRFTPQPDGTTAIYFQQHSDPGGSLPSMLVNQLVKDIPYNTLRNFRHLVKEAK